MLEELQAIAAEERRTVSQLVSFAIEEWMDKYRREHGGAGKGRK